MVDELTFASHGGVSAARRFARHLPSMDRNQAHNASGSDLTALCEMGVPADTSWMASTAPSSSSGSLAANAFLPFRSHPAAGGKAVGRPRTIALDRLGAMLKRSSGPDEAFELDMVLGGLVVDFCCADLCLAFDLAEAGADAQTKTKQLEAMGVRLVTLPAEAFTGWHKFAARSHASQVIGAEIHIARSRMEYIADWGCKAPF